MTGKARFLDFCAAHYPTPADTLAAFFDEAVDAAASVGALLESLPELDGRRHYLPNAAGRRDQKQFYLASIETDKDGTTWPAVTFKSFKGATVYWKPRDLAWRAFESCRGMVAANDSARQEYKARADAAKATADAKAAAYAAAESEGERIGAEFAETVWATADACQAHPYLASKGVASHGLRVATDTVRGRLFSKKDGEWIERATVVDQGDLLVPMYDEAGALVNLQRINVEGVKRPITGARMRGVHFRIDGTTSRTVLAEGYATGATWHEATGDTVVLSFNAPMLPIVAGYVRADMVAADNDESGTGEREAKKTGLPYLMPETVGHDWNDAGIAAVRDAVANDSATVFKRPFDLPTIELKGREQTWWNKLRDAETPADAAAIAWAIARRLSVRVPVQMDLPALVDQLRQAVPAGKMHPTTLNAMSDALARFIEWRKARALAGVSMTGAAIGHHRVETVEELPQLSENDYRGVLLVQAPMGSGKTQRIGEPFARWTRHRDGRFVATCHRQSLVAELAKRLVCDHYQEFGADYAWSVDALATCLPSIVKGVHQQIIAEAAFLFIDEIAQVLRSVGSSVTVAEKKGWPDVFRTLRDMVTRARCIIGADAGMDDRVIAFLEGCRPGERFSIIQQPHRPAGLGVRFGFGPDALATAYGEATARLMQGERLWIGCGERTRAIEAARVLEASGARILLIHGDNAANAEQATFLANIEAESRNYDCVIHTGVISSGVSIEHRDGAHFTHGMLLASGATITPADAMQMLRRVRYLRSWTIAATPNNARDIDNADAILAGMEQAAGIEGINVTSCTDFDSFVAGIDADNARHRADFAAGLWWALEHQGFAVDPLDVIRDEAKVAELRAIRADLRDEKRAAILSAPDMDDEQARRLRDRPARTEAENYALLRHRIKSDLGLDALDDEAVDVWDDGRGPRRMDRFSAATRSVADRRDHQGDDLALKRFSKARALAYAWLLDGIEFAAGLRVTESLASGILARVIERRYLLAFLGIVPAKWASEKVPAAAYPVKEVGEIFDRMGLEMKRREGTAFTPTTPDIPLGEITASGGKSARNRWHELTATSWGKMVTWSERRNSRRQTTLVEQPTIDEAFWHGVRIAMLADAQQGMPVWEAMAEWRARVDARGLTHGARVTAFWLRHVLPGRLAA